jgi:hypothetical protein
MRSCKTTISAAYSVMANRKKEKPQKPNYQRKQGKPGAKSLRGCPEIYDQKKRQFNITLTPQAIITLAEIAILIGESRSQVIEKAIRGEIDLLELSQHKNTLQTTE